MKKSNRIDVSLILGCYNEGPTLHQSLINLKKAMDDSRFSWECICIDDHSQDETFRVLKNFANSKKNFKIFLHKKNIGRGGTVSEGIKMAKGRIVGYVDIDLEVSPVYIPLFVRAIEDGSEVAIATRIYKITMTNLIRSLSTKIYVSLVKLFLGLNFKDTEAGYKFFNRKKILSILNQVEDKRWFFDTEIVARSHWMGFNIREIPVLFVKRADKASTVRLISDTITYIISLWNFRRKKI